MTSVRSLGQLEQILNDSFSWRRTELSSLRSAIDNIRDDVAHDPRDRAMVRSMSVLLYAHWEGFCKEAFTSYVDYIRYRKPSYGSLSDGLLLATFQKLRSFTDPDDGRRQDILAVLRGAGESRARLPTASEVVKTESNLRFKTLNQIMTQLDLPTDELVTRGKVIDKSLCDQRNAIAHGRYHLPATASTREMHDAVLDMMGKIREMIVDHAQHERYLRPT
jgi:hypothetical protein